MTTLYTGQATAFDGRDGYVATSDNVWKIDVARPESLGGTEIKPNASNPEQLFAMAYASCFGGALKEIARERQRIISEPQVNAQVSLNKTEIDGFHLSVKLNVHIPDLTKNDTHELVQAAQQICPYSKAVRNNIKVIFD